MHPLDQRGGACLHNGTRGALYSPAAPAVSFKTDALVTHATSSDLLPAYTTHRHVSLVLHPRRQGPHTLL